MKYIKTNKIIILLIVMSVIGSILLIVGPLLPWFTFLGGLQTFPGIAGLNGKIFLGSGILTLGISIFYLIKKAGMLHWVLGFIGFSQFAFSCYLLFNLYKTFHQISSGDMNSMMDAGIGPGLFVTAAGAFLIFCILFIPIKKRESINNAVSTKKRGPLYWYKFLRIRTNYLGIKANKS